jgi:hypothetical protein
MLISSYNAGEHGKKASFTLAALVGMKVGQSRFWDTLAVCLNRFIYSTQLHG